MKGYAVFTKEWDWSDDEPRHEQDSHSVTQLETLVATIRAI